MDELLWPLCSPLPSPASSFFSDIGANHQIIEFSSCEVPEQWLLGDVEDTNESYFEKGEALGPVGCTLLPASDLSDEQPPPRPQVQDPSVKAPVQRPAKKKREWKHEPHRPDGPTVSHVQVQRQRRDRLNRRFCDLRAVVPTVSRRDKASLLAAAATYISKLRARVAQLEATEARRQPVVAASRGAAIDEAVDVRMVGPNAATVRATSAITHAPARLMAALRALDLHVQHACVSRVNGVTVQNVFVNAVMMDADGLRALLVQMLLGSGCS